MEAGKMIKGTATKKTPVTHSNWFGGNVDPEDLKRYSFTFSLISLSNNKTNIN